MSSAPSDYASEVIGFIELLACEAFGERTCSSSEDARLELLFARWAATPQASCSLPARGSNRLEMAGVSIPSRAARFEADVSHRLEADVALLDRELRAECRQLKRRLARASGKI